MPGVFVRILSSCVPSDFCKTYFFNSTYFSVSEHAFKPFDFNNMIKPTAGSRANTIT